MSITYRSIEPKDAEDFFYMMSALDKETSFMLYEPDEREKNLDKVKESLMELLVVETFFYLL